eukprot:CAMPEP_0174847520 /NCGR_PEP_ID=MMETSP1114-20130205/12963_1 /TAXON_ID=312471 /ORGANISM="Neobodo designis, Strain CCAP 1951/1" /LENGTH=62 /DNA_ID=CAMNT_0016081801 /DNA_START=8 /DNA_END=193 /DNA_ORIENTATION=+
MCGTAGFKQMRQILVSSNAPASTANPGMAMQSAVSPSTGADVADAPDDRAMDTSTNKVQKLL